jgi:hypothetical protein
MAQKKTTGKKPASKKGKAASKKGRPAHYKLNKKGDLVGPNGRKVKLDLGDIPIVINGGSLSIVSVGNLDDDEHPGHKTRQLRSTDTVKHITFIELIGFSAGPNPTTFVPTNPPTCAIFIHYA